MFAGVAAKRSTSGNSLLSCCVTTNAAIVASTSAPKANRTRGALMRGRRLVEAAAPSECRSVRVQLVDPSGDVTPYDHALAGALARRGAEVELVTSRFVHGPVPSAR